MSRETFHIRLARLRHEQNLSQRALSAPGITYAYISRLEANQRVASLKAIRLLAKKLGVSALYLETGQDKYCPHCGRKLESEN